MKKTLAYFAFLGLLTGSLWAENEAPRLKSQAAAFANANGFDSLNKMIETQELAWKSRPSISYFYNMSGICSAIADSSAASSDKGYWLFREIVWRVILKSTPTSEDVRGVDSTKDDLIRAAAGATPYVVKCSPEMYNAIRHDTAMMIITYANELDAAIIPNYKDKPMAAINEEPTKEEEDNLIENEFQSEVSVARQRLAVIVSADYLMDAYSHPPKANEELMLLLKFLNFQGDDRAMILDRAKTRRRLPPGFPAGF